MNNRRVLGQEATEFVLISILVFLSALLVVFIFGNKIASFFTQESSAINAANAGSKAIDPQKTPKYDNTSDETLATGVSGVTTGDTTNLNHLNITQNADGSISFTASGQNLNLNSNVQNNIETVMQTTAGSAKTEIIKEIASLLAKYEQLHPGQAVPQVQLSFGRSDVSESEGNYQGTASTLSTATIKVGDLFVNIQKDIQCADNDCLKGDKKQRKLEGTITGLNTFDGNVSYWDSTSSTYINPLNTVNSIINLKNGTIDSIGANYSGHVMNLSYKENNSYNITQ